MIISKAMPQAAALLLTGLITIPAVAQNASVEATPISEWSGGTVHHDGYVTEGEVVSYGFPTHNVSSNGGAFLPFGYDSYTPPDAGFQLPVPYAIERDPVQYQRYYPSTYYGLPGSVHPQVLPIIATPTDTTQLGFYYQRVPTWTPVPGMIPPPPNPNYYHTRTPPSGYMTPGHTMSHGTVIRRGEVKQSAPSTAPKKIKPVPSVESPPSPMARSANSFPNVRPVSN
ncbi:hypothetical protein [Stratiformator vulcanicus]|uniref:Uncharacterized protein n=1 Tax=Stratiformator vulcanicus TaxID=2527980 RepID=A0A517R705_9PLAN|nr:hypothetical protein [Stratiformator vulcanicus]QDT39613.1 hypothetical protein Pan189_40220 [Stratiformator vulcanicus]